MKKKIKSVDFHICNQILSRQDLGASACVAPKGAEKVRWSTYAQPCYKLDGVMKIFFSERILKIWRASW